MTTSRIKTFLPADAIAPGALTAEKSQSPGSEPADADAPGVAALESQSNGAEPAADAEAPGPATAADAVATGLEEGLESLDNP